MFGLGMPEIIVILVIALIIFGPSKLPEVARGIGKGIREFKDMTMGVERSMKDEFEAIIQDGEEPPKAADKPKPPAEKAEETKPVDETEPVDETKPANETKTDAKSEAAGDKTA